MPPTLTTNPPPNAASKTTNIADRLRTAARRVPDQPAIIIPPRRWRSERRISFAELDSLCDRLAAGLIRHGIEPGERIVLMVKPGIEFFSLTFALFRAGATIVLIDPGMGISRVANCLAEVDPHGFAAIPIVHLLRRTRSRRFPHANHNICVGRSCFRDAVSYDSLRQSTAEGTTFPTVKSTDSAAIIFTSGGTGPPKGVVYEHGMFAAQVDFLRERFAIEAGEVDLPGFPLFALFNAALGVTTVVPKMDPTRPARVDPRNIINPIRDYQVTQAFGSPALWNRVGRYCQKHHQTIPHLKRAFSAGAPVPLPILEQMTKALAEPDAAFHTPYGATEALPVAVIDADTVLQETAAASRRGAGTCVGPAFPGVDVQIIHRTNQPIAEINDARPMPAGEIGEIIVRSSAATREYYQRPEATALAKIRDGESFWHRMGDVGYLDESGRLWFCGRKAHVVETEHGPLYSVCCEAIFNEHPRVYRSALVGIGPAGKQIPLIIIELEPDGVIRNNLDRSQLFDELRRLAEGNPLTSSIDRFLIHENFPVDARHNIKINREQLARWAAKRIS